MMGVLGYMALLLGSVMYSYIFSKKEFRTVLILEILIDFIGGLMGAVFILDFHQKVGISNEAFFSI